MTDEEIKYNVIKEFNGVKSMSKEQVDDFIDLMFFILPIEDNRENRRTIVDGIRMYFNICINNSL